MLTGTTVSAGLSHVMMAAPFIDGDENKLSVADLDLALIKQAKEALKLLIRDKEVEQKGGRWALCCHFNCLSKNIVH